MKNQSPKVFTLLVAGACAVTLLTPRAHAVPTLTLFDGTTTIVVTDGSGLDQSGAAGVVTFNGVIGVWDINVTTGLTKPVLGSASAPEMDLNSIDHSTGAGILTITFSETGFTAPSGMVLTAIGGTQDNGTIKYVADQGTNHLTSIGALNSTPFASSATGVLTGATNYTLSQVVTLTHTAAGVTSFDATLHLVPDGGMTAMMLGLGLLGVEGLRRKFLVA